MSTRLTEGFRPRHLLAEIAAALADTRVVLLAGARQVGKSTAAQLTLAGRPGVLELTLDDPQTLAAALADPAGLVTHDGLIFIDEVQRAPELLLAIKAAVDRVRRPGQFLLTGSANVLTMPTITDALPGRMEIVHLWPFSQGEIEGQVDSFIDHAFVAPPARFLSALTKRDYVHRAARGGFPEVVLRSEERRRDAWFASYIEAIVQRELRTIAEVANAGELPRLLRLLAARAGQPLNISKLAEDARLSASTTSRYLDLLETAFAIIRVPAWETSRTTRAVRKPKLFFPDSGLLCHLLGVNAAALARPVADAGPVLENFVAMELARQLGWSSLRARLHHYRNRDGVEVDIILEAADGRLVGIEVKAGATVRSQDFAGLRHIADRAGDRFQAGIVLNTSAVALPFGDRLWALPISALWESWN